MTTKMKVFMQDDDQYEISFIWSENHNELDNILSSVYGDKLKRFFNDDDELVTHGYPTRDLSELKNTLSMIFDEILVMEDNSGCASDFISLCKEKYQ